MHTRTIDKTQTTQAIAESSGVDVIDEEIMEWLQSGVRLTTERAAKRMVPESDTSIYIAAADDSIGIHSVSIGVESCSVDSASHVANVLESCSVGNGTVSGTHVDGVGCGASREVGAQSTSQGMVSCVDSCVDVEGRVDLSSVVEEVLDWNIVDTSTCASADQSNARQNHASSNITTTTSTTTTSPETIENDRFGDHFLNCAGKPLPSARSMPKEPSPTTCLPNAESARLGRGEREPARRADTVLEKVMVPTIFLVIVQLLSHVQLPVRSHVQLAMSIRQLHRHYPLIANLPMTSFTLLPRLLCQPLRFLLRAMVWVLMGRL